jgi:hypothetical protein
MNQPSFAGHTYANFVRGLQEIELVRLCSLWDGAERDAFSVPTAIALIDDNLVIDCMARENASHSKALTADTPVSGEYDETDRKLIREAKAKWAEREWDEAFDRTTRLTRNTIRLGRIVANSDRLRNVRNFRNKYIAHSTGITREERELGTVLPIPALGDEIQLLRITLKLLERLELCARGAASLERADEPEGVGIWAG